MRGRILSELMIAGRLNLYELARRVRIGIEEPNKLYGATFRKVLFELLSERKIAIDVDSMVMVCV